MDSMESPEMRPGQAKLTIEQALGLDGAQQDEILARKLPDDSVALIHHLEERTGAKTASRLRVQPCASSSGSKPASGSYVCLSNHFHSQYINLHSAPEVHLHSSTTLILNSTTNFTLNLYQLYT